MSTRLVTTALPAAPRPARELFARTGAAATGVVRTLARAADGLLPAARGPVLPPANPERCPLSFGQRVFAKLDQAFELARPLPGTVESAALRHLAGARGALSFCSKAGDAELAAMPDSALAHLATSLGTAGPLDVGDRSARSVQLMRVLTAHGADRAHVEALTSRLPGDCLETLDAAAKKRLDALLASDPAKPGDWAGFQRYLDAATGTKQVPGTKVEPLVNGDTAFPAMFSAVDAAKSSVDMTVFSFQSDQAGWQMAQHLAAASGRGVKVRLVYDPIGSHKSDGGPTDPAVYAYLRQHGVEVLAQPPGALGGHLTHRKIAVVDGEVGFVGGMNVGDEFAYEWHDVHSRVTGPGVAELQRLFVEQWKADGGKLSAQEEAALYPPLAPVPGGGEVRVLGHVGGEDRNMKLAYLRAIGTAQTSIHVADPYFNDPDVARALEAAARRGVDVRLELPKATDKSYETEAEHALFDELIASGVKIYEYGGRPMAHEKVAVFDGKIATLGSSNLDARSLSMNDEANVWTSDPGVAQNLEQNLFAADLPQCMPVKAYKPGLFRKFEDDLLRRIEGQL